MTDLHTHTDASDGSLTRAQLLELAISLKLDSVAITDHDTMANAGPRPGDPLRVIPGAELSSRDAETGRKVHILCYFPAFPQALDGYFALMRERRYQNGERLYAEVHKLYPFVTRSELERYSHAGFYMKQHFIDVLQDYGCADYVYGDLFKKLFHGGLIDGATSPQYGSLDEVLELVREARGVAVMAHPGEYSGMPAARRLAASGRLDGFEVDHPRNSPAEAAELSALAAQYGLIATGGTDYHGRNNSAPILPGERGVSPSEFVKLCELADKRR